MIVGCLDTQGLLDLFSRVAGRRLLGVVDGVGVVELVFEGPDGNLVSICCDRGRHTGLVDSPEQYVEACSWQDAA